MRASIAEDICDVITNYGSYHFSVLLGRSNAKAGAGNLSSSVKATIDHGKLR